MGFPRGAGVKNQLANTGDAGWIPGSGRSSEIGKLTPVFLPGKSHWTEKPDRLQSMGPQRVRQDRATEHAGRQAGSRKRVCCDQTLQPTTLGPSPDCTFLAGDLALVTETFSCLIFLLCTMKIIVVPTSGLLREEKKKSTCKLHT